MAKKDRISQLRKQGRKQEADILAAGGAGRQAAKMQEKGLLSGGGVYTVQAGDSYFSIAGDVYGDQAFFEQLQLYNPNVRALRPGMKIKLPRLNNSARPTVSYAAAANAGIAIPESLAAEVGYVNPAGGNVPAIGAPPGVGGSAPNYSPTQATQGLGQVKPYSPTQATQGIGQPVAYTGLEGFGTGLQSIQPTTPPAYTPTRTTQGLGAQPGQALSSPQYVQPVNVPNQTAPKPQSQATVSPQQAEAARLTLQALSGQGFAQGLPNEISYGVVAQFEPDVLPVLAELGYVENSSGTGVVLTSIADAVSSTNYQQESTSGYFLDGANYAALGAYAARLPQVSMGRGGQGIGTIYEDNGYDSFGYAISGLYNWRNSW